MRVYFPLIAAIFLSCNTYAQETNGCGTGWNRYLVPDRIKILGCEFRAACDSHDICYGKCSNYGKDSSPPQCQYLRCEKGGDLWGTEVCDSVPFKKNRIAADLRRAECDAKFMINISKLNPENRRCDIFSGFYPFVVRALGGNNFLGMENSPTASLSEAERIEYANAINLAFSTLPDDELAEIFEQTQGDKPTLDLSKPIEFDPRFGLRNKSIAR